MISFNDVLCRFHVAREWPMKLFSKMDGRCRRSETTRSREGSDPDVILMDVQTSGPAFGPGASTDDFGAPGRTANSDVERVASVADLGMTHRR